MSVCWDAEASGRAPCGALSSQSSAFLLMSRMIMRVSDGVLAGDQGGARLLRRLQLEPQRVLQRHRGVADEPRVAVARAQILQVERALLLALADRAGAGDRAVADDLDPRPDPLPCRARDRGGEGDP